MKANPGLFALPPMFAVALGYVALWLPAEFRWPVFAVLALALALVTAAHAAISKRDSRAAMLWITLICFLPLVGAGLYLLLGINRIQRRAVRLRRKAVRQFRIASGRAVPEQPEPSLPASMRHLESTVAAIGSLVRKPLTAGNRFELLIDGDAAFPAMLAEIAVATRSISLSTYLFGADEAGLAFVEALAAAVRRGVAVRVLIDASNTLLAHAGIFRALRRGGVPHARFLPAFSHWPPVTLNLRNHRKILVVDGQCGFTGGMNIVAAHRLRRHPPHPAADIQFRIEGPVVAHLQEAFADDWVFTTGEVLCGDAWFPPLVAVGNVMARGIASGPDDRLEKLRWSMLAAIAGAKRSLRILTPYFLPDLSIIGGLSVARRRGVEVDIVLPASSDVPFVQWASASQWWQLLEHGCRIWIAPAPFDHTKLAIIDASWLLLGSANWDPRSLRLNFEFNVECYDHGLARSLAEIFEQRRRAAREITLADADGRSLPIRLRDGMARLAMPFM